MSGSSEKSDVKEPATVAASDLNGEKLNILVCRLHPPSKPLQSLTDHGKVFRLRRRRETTF